MSEPVDEPTPDVAERFTRHFDLVMRRLRQPGLLLCAYGERGAPNAMTIGWGSLGWVWGMPVWTVLVRPSRYTHECIEAGRAFSVCVPTQRMTQACAICGSRSGRDGDKLRLAGLAARHGEVLAVPVLEGCAISYECSVVHANDVNPGLLIGMIGRSAYADGDYHRVYWGRIDHVRFDEALIDQ
jgi:flavin reductase (DIM6/NTAB) family NADH-FMN oxidoreductase RutF